MQLRLEWDNVTCGTIEVGMQDVIDQRRKHIVTLLKRADAPWVAKQLRAYVEGDVRATDGRSALAQQKASGCLSGTGICVTLTLTLGGPMLVDERWDSHPVLFSSLVASFVVAAIFGLAAAWYAIRAMSVRGDHSRYSFDAVFDDKVVSRYSDEGADGERKFDAYLLAHSWAVNEQNFDVDTQRLDDVRIAQTCFVGLLLMIAVTAMILASSAIYR